MIEKYAAWRYNLEVAVLIVGGIAVFFLLCWALYCMWKGK